MFLNQKTSGTVNQQGMGLANTMQVADGNVEKITSMLVMAYSSPVTTIRELIVNAMEAHQVAGVNDPVVVEFTSDEKDTGRALLTNNGPKPFTEDTKVDYPLTMKVIDHGVGMSREFMETKLTSMGFSTKENTDLPGGFGIGMKAALAFADEMIIMSVRDDVKSVLVIGVDEAQRSPKFSDVVSHPTDEPNGTVVEVTFPAAHHRRIVDSIEDELLTYLDPCAVEVTYNDEVLAAGRIFQSLVEAEEAYGAGVYGAPVDHDYDASLVLMVDGLPYPLSFEMADAIFSDPDVKALDLQEKKYVVKVSSKDAILLHTRENVVDTPHLRQTIVDELVKLRHNHDVFLGTDFADVDLWYEKLQDLCPWVEDFTVDDVLGYVTIQSPFGGKCVNSPRFSTDVVPSPIAKPVIMVTDGCPHNSTHYPNLLTPLYNQNREIAPTIEYALSDLNGDDYCTHHLVPNQPRGMVLPDGSTVVAKYSSSFFNRNPDMYECFNGVSTDGPNGFLANAVSHLYGMPVVSYEDVRKQLMSYGRKKSRENKVSFSSGANRKTPISVFRFEKSENNPEVFIARTEKVLYSGKDFREYVESEARTRFDYVMTRQFTPFDDSYFVADGSKHRVSFPGWADKAESSLLIKTEGRYNINKITGPVVSTEWSVHDSDEAEQLRMFGYKHKVELKNENKSMQPNLMFTVANWLYVFHSTLDAGLCYLKAVQPATPVKDRPFVPRSETMNQPFVVLGDTPMSTVVCDVVEKYLTNPGDDVTVSHVVKDSLPQYIKQLELCRGAKNFEELFAAIRRYCNTVGCDVDRYIQDNYRYRLPNTPTFDEFTPSNLNEFSYPMLVDSYLRHIDIGLPSQLREFSSLATGIGQYVAAQYRFLNLDNLGENVYNECDTYSMFAQIVERKEACT